MSYNTLIIENGLSQSGDTGILGGTLTQDTTIDGNSTTFGLIFQNLSTFDVNLPVAGASFQAAGFEVNSSNGGPIQFSIDDAGIDGGEFLFLGNSGVGTSIYIQASATSINGSGYGTLFGFPIELYQNITGTAKTAPLYFQPSGSVPLATPEIGALEATGNTLFYTGLNGVRYPLAAGNPQSVSNSDGTLIISPTSGNVIASLNLANNNTWTGIQSFSPGDLVLLPNTTLHPSIKFTPSGSTLLTTPVAGSLEVDSVGTIYYTASNSRAIISTEHFMSSTTTYGLTSQTAAQKLFNGSANGAFNPGSDQTYFFECDFNLTGLSATSGTFGFGFGGTAVIASQAWKAQALKSANNATAGTSEISLQTATATNLTPANALTQAVCKIFGIVRITTGGTLIPQVSMTVAAAATVGANSFIRLWKIGNSSVLFSGNWT